MLTFAAGSEKPYNDKGYYRRRNCRRLNRFLRSGALRRPQMLQKCISKSRLGLQPLTAMVNFSAGHLKTPQRKRLSENKHFKSNN
ncbi:TPA: hypothetical protein U6I84_004784 [Klebsiella quasipneumoniae]|uniref:hypothetical protein n=1 Tax=Klebsiella quasipneumoniae TaxID=1463165 RepID=UPI0015D4ECEA|nr:hypothetical protein [Klebsiella quasipneumoniae]HEN5127388.1 hypothetical protein [Klebsiella quasipneumoniae]